MSETRSVATHDIVMERLEDGIACVRIARPQKRNAMSLAMWQEMAQIYARLDADRSVRSIVLSGDGGAFCAGADISEFATKRSSEADGAAYDRQVDATEQSIIRSQKPTIAAISGACIGGGLGLALCCDFRFADDTSYFAIPASRLGIVYGITETRQLLNAVGLPKAREILFTGRRFKAAEAAQIGLITHRTMGPVTDDAIAFARTLAVSAPRTIMGSKLVLRALSEGTLSAHEAEIRSTIKAATASQDYREGVAAFAHRRPPRFTGD